MLSLMFISHFYRLPPSVDIVELHSIEPLVTEWSQRNRIIYQIGN